MLLFLASIAVASAGAAQALPFYVESGGQVVMEAETFSVRSGAVDLPDGPADSDPDQWLVVPDEGAASQPFANARGSFLQVTDANGVNGEGNFSNPTGIGPFVDYVMQISTLGTYDLFARWDSPSSSNDSFYVMLFDPTDTLIGSAITFTGGSNQRDLDFATGSWDSDASWSIGSAGTYTLRIAPREDGAALDTFVFQESSLAAPTGVGPPAQTPVPEPGTGALVMVGLVMLASRFRNRAE